MIKSKDLPDTIAVFPLPGALLLPRARLPLHLFEPRYLAMLDDVLKAPTRLIGMVQPYEGPDGDKLHTIGCAGRVSAFSETEDGRYMITLSGVSRFRIQDEVEGFTPYRRCNVTWDGFERDLGASEKDPDFNRDSFMGSLSKFFEVQGLNTDWESLGEAEEELLINSLSMLCPFEQRTSRPAGSAEPFARRETLTTLIEFALRGGSGEEVMQ